MRTIFARFKGGPQHKSHATIEISPEGIPPRVVLVPMPGELMLFEAPVSAETLLPATAVSTVVEYHLGECDGQEAVYHFRP